MERKAKAFNNANVSMATYLAKKRIDSTLKLAKQITDDVDKSEREKKQLCKACHYSSRIAGQAFTTQPCACCLEPQTYSSTATDELCKPCAEKHELCKRCGGDIKMRSQRKSVMGDDNDTNS